jgi:uncharacterized RDD family membrane protein YckC
MSALEGGSIPPPGWDRAHGLSGGAGAAVTSADLTAHYEAMLASGVDSTPLTEQAPAEAAVRWRMRAATVDNLLVYALYLLVCAVLHWRVAQLSHLIVLLLLGVVYHFALESQGGQTLGKRRYGIRVVALDGQPAAPKAIALRNLLRAIDSLPFSYLSGLISMVRTGPERRQRLGDVVAETKVIAVGGHAANRGTAGWVLPAATILAFAVSAIGIFSVVEAGRQPLTGSQQAQFVTGCENSAHGTVDCQCLLNRLEADGYNTPDDINSLVQDANNERFYGQPGTARTELVNDTTACLR